MLYLSRIREFSSPTDMIIQTNYDYYMVLVTNVESPLRKFEVIFGKMCWSLVELFFLRACLRVFFH